MHVLLDHIVLTDLDVYYHQARMNFHFRVMLSLTRMVLAFSQEQVFFSTDLKVILKSA